jgi:hypothetical protein
MASHGFTLPIGGKEIWFGQYDAGECMVCGAPNPTRNISPDTSKEVDLCLACGSSFMVAWAKDNKKDFDKVKVIIK